MEPGLLPNSKLKLAPKRKTNSFIYIKKNKKGETLMNHINKRQPLNKVSYQLVHFLLTLELGGLQSSTE